MHVFFQTSSIRKELRSPWLPVLQSVTIGNREKKIVAEAWYKWRTVVYHYSTEVINSSPKSRCLWRESLTWGYRAKKQILSGFEAGMLNQVGRIEWFQSENGFFDIFLCFEMMFEQCCDSVYSHVWWFTDEMAEKDKKKKPDQPQVGSAGKHSS